MSVSAVFAEDPHPPVPNQSTARNATTTNDGIQVPGMPIDQGLFYLVLSGLTLGIVMIYKDKIKKASL
ncbi:hypothetical protein D3C85_1464140 [compost metagenome]